MCCVYFHGRRYFFSFTQKMEAACEWYLSTKLLHSVTFQMIAIFTVTAMKTSGLKRVARYRREYTYFPNAFLYSTDANLFEIQIEQQHITPP
jgi:hypothetical protein